MNLTLRWRVPERPVTTRWRGPEGMARALARDPALSIAAIVGPPGPPGPQGPAAADAQPLRINASLASTWILAHPLGRLPTVHVFLSGNEPVLTDVSATTTQITVTFPSPQQGFVLAF
jgi:hypothetical protein